MYWILITYYLFSGVPQPLEERILFSSSRSGNSDIFIMDNNGANLRQITNSTLEEWSPVWISDSEISYLQQAGEIIKIVMHDLQTGETSQIHQPPNCTLDDKNMLYALDRKTKAYGCMGEIYLEHTETMVVDNITSKIDGTANYIAWGAEANQISFTSDHEGNNDIYLYDWDTKSLTNLINHPANDERGDISPDGKTIVFSTNRFDETQQDIAIQNLETGEVTRITNTSGNELIARWSNDNKHIYCGGNADGNWEVYRYDLSTGLTTRLTENDSFDGDPRVR